MKEGNNKWAVQITTTMTLTGISLKLFVANDKIKIQQDEV